MASMIVPAYIILAIWYGIVKTPGYGFSDELAYLIFRPIPIIASVIASIAQSINLIPNSCMRVLSSEERCYFLAPFSSKNLVSS